MWLCGWLGCGQLLCERLVELIIFLSLVQLPLVPSPLSSLYPESQLESYATWFCPVSLSF